ncbi:hypothetical protein QA601_14185 [Chitinispirillales bacterium ANBcel5]|uniref:hypothetical protein n=1 Tax=Cellulosispirillum alkaliphilum TaxID=3039283 RepID=UPI002A52D72A|nr:hypothetical protein [Chitinispirillales bacterium ANBcel5]
MKIVKLSSERIENFRALWEELNSYHEKKSSWFKSHFRNFTFQKRSEQLLKKRHLRFLQP